MTVYIDDRERDECVADEASSIKRGFYKEEL